MSGKVAWLLAAACSTTSKQGRTYKYTHLGANKYHFAGPKRVLINGFQLEPVYPDLHVYFEFGPMSLGRLYILPKLQALSMRTKNKNMEDVWPQPQRALT